MIPRSLSLRDLPFRGSDKLNFHDTRRFKNSVDQFINQKSRRDRSLELGHSEKVNEEHYSSNFDQGVIRMSEEIKSLQAQILILKSQLKSEAS